MMDMNDSEKSNKELETTALVEMNNTPCVATLNLDDAEVSNDKNVHIIVQDDQSVREELEKQNISKDSTISSASHTEDSDSVGAQNIINNQNDETFQKDSSGINKNSLNETKESIKEKTINCESTVVVVKSLKPLCADYKSDSDSESVDSESDSSTMSTNSTTDTSSEDEYSSDDTCDSSTSEKDIKLEERKVTTDLSLCELPPIEDLKISVSENECVEIGTITSIVDTLVVVESYKGTAALDLDTVLFLDCGKRTLGKVFDVLGPITEPVYTIRFNSQEQIKNLNIEKNLKVYYAPKTHHTTYVFMSEVLKNKGSDASWKDNTEAPTEFQDFSDDEQERIHIKKQENVGQNLSLKEPNKSKKRPFNKVKPSSEVFQTSGFRNPNFCWQRRTNIQRNSSSNQPAPPLSWSPSGHPNSFDSIQTPSIPFHPSVNAGPSPPRVCFPPRFSGPPFPVFGSFPHFNQNQIFQQPFYQQRAHGYLQNNTVGSWDWPGRPMFRYQLPPPLPPPPPPPPPPAPTDQGDHRP